MESGQGARVNADGKWMGRTSTLKWDGGRQIGKADENCLTSWEFPIFFPLQYLLAWAQDAQNPKWKPGMARESSRRASGSGPRSRKVSPWRSEKTEKITNFFLTFPPPFSYFFCASACRHSRRTSGGSHHSGGSTGPQCLKLWGRGHLARRETSMRFPGGEPLSELEQWTRCGQTVWERRHMGCHSQLETEV